MDGKKVEDDQKMAKRTKWVPLNKHFTSQNRHFPTFNFILFCVKRKSLEDISVWNYAKLVKKNKCLLLTIEEVFGGNSN